MSDFFIEPETTVVNTDYYFKLKQDLEIYRFAIAMIKQELESEESNQTKVNCIKQYIEELEKQL